MPHRRCPSNEHVYDDREHAECPHCLKQGQRTAYPNPPPAAGTQLLTPGQPVGSQLTVGWLVITDGPGRGRNFTLLPGENRIGRSPRMEIALNTDTSVSGEDHAKLIYDPEHKRFYLWHDKGKNLTYVNGELIDRRELQAYDRIKIGQTTLLFIPLCGDKFQWQG